jgi:polyhydroxyalkanoate synthase
MFCYYVRNTYLENKLREPGALTMCGEKVDLGSLDIPVFVYASKEDHIVPWKSAYESTQLLRNARFVLGASGHIAGVINPPAKLKRNFWVAPEGGGTPADPDAWFEAAEKVPGSWWPTWYEWLAPNGGTQVNARGKLGSAQFAPLEEAPGSYVKQKAP